ncbi:MAG: hypothetical protein IPN33_17770 [Saprospiraceae bacterium]|nr:hypothetical protein [Saprospiraceae bacterium]
MDNIVVTGIACATTVNVSGEPNPCLGSTHIYSIVSPPANHSFSWSLVGGGGTITPAMDNLSASVTWNDAGPRTVRVTAIDNLTNCISEHDYNIVVRSGPTVTAIADFGPFCPGTNFPAISLSTTPLNNSVSFSWTGGASIGIPDGSDNTAPFEIPGFAAQNAGGTALAPSVSVTATDNAFGCTGTAELFAVTVNPAPDLVLNGAPAVCSGSTFDLATLIDTNLPNGEVEDQNSVGSLGFLVYTTQPYILANQLNNLMVSPSASTTYYFVKPTLGGCLDDLAVLLQVQGPVTINSISADEVICAGDDASFTVSASNAGDGTLLYQWEVNDGMGFVDVTNGGIYSGATTATLNITDATIDQNGYQYQVKVSTSACPVQTSSSRTLTVKPRPALQATINGVTVTDNYDGVDDTGSFTVCNSVPNNISINAFTDLNGVMQAGQVKVLQEVMLTNVAAPFCNGCVALLSTFTGAMGTATLVDPSMPGTLVLKFRAFYDDNNSNTLDAGDCAGDWVIYTITVGNIPNVSATTDLPLGGGIYATCSDEDFTITIDGTGNPVGTTYSADWSLSPVSGTPDLMLVSGTGDFANKPTTTSTSFTLTGSFINPAPNVNSIQIDLIITATTPDGCTNTFPMVIYLRPEISVTGITGLPATVCSGEMTPVANVAISLPSGTRSITWAWSGTDITATPATGGPDNSAPFQVGATTLLNNSGDPRTATLTVTPNRTYATPVAQQCPGDEFDITVSVEPGPLVANQSKTICSDEPSGVTLGTSTNLVPVNTYNITSINDGGLTASAGAPATGSGLAANVIADDAWTNTTNANVDVIYTIIPVSAAGCLGPAFTVTLTIRPEPVVPFQSGDMACSDVAIDVKLGNSNPFVSAFNITNIDANGLASSAGNPVTGTGFSDDEIEDDAWTNTTGSPVNVIYTVIPVSLDGCLATSLP